MKGMHVHRVDLPRWFVAISAAALLLRCALWLQYMNSPFAASPVGDESHYWELADRIVSGGWRPTEVFYQGPLYPYFLATIKAVFPSFGQGALAALQLLVNWMTCLLLLPFLRRWMAEREAMTATVLALFFAPGVFFALKGVTNTIGLLLMVAGLLFLPNEEKGWFRRVALSGALFGIGVLTVPSSLFLAGAAALFLFFFPPVKRRVLPPAILLLATFLFLSPATISNYFQDGSLTLVSSDFGEAFLQGNNPNAAGGYTAVFSTFVGEEKREVAGIARRESGRSLNHSGVSHHFFAKGLDFITGSPWRWLLIEVKKAGLLLGGLDIPHEFSLARERRDQLSCLWAFPVGGLAVLLLASLGLVARETRQRSILPLMGAAAFATICLIFYVANRYVHQFQFFLLPAAAAGLLSVPGLSERPARVVALIPGLIAALFTWQWLDKPGWEVAYLGKLAVAHEQSGNDRMADATMDRMMAADSTNPLVYEVLGTLTHRRGDLETALWAMDRAIELDPGVSNTRYFRGWLLWEAGREEDAVAAMTEVLALDPHHTEARMARIRLSDDLGKWEDSERDWREGVALAADPHAFHLGYSEWLFRRGRIREGESEREAARRLSSPVPGVRE